MENDGRLTGLGTLGRKLLRIMGMNWRYVHKETQLKKHYGRS